MFFSYKDKLKTAQLGIMNTGRWFTDGLSILMVALTIIIVALCIVWVHSLDEIQADTVVCIKVIEFCLVNAFATTDLLNFYIFFELSAIPLLFLIGRRGPSDRRIKAAQYFLGYTLFGSAFLLSAVLVIHNITGSTNYYDVLVNIENFTPAQLNFIWLCFFIAFAVKIPTVPFHLWLLEAHVEAPTTGSVLLAAVLLKIGGYGLIRFCIQLLGNTSTYFYPLVFTIGICSVLFATLNAFIQIDLKRIIAYSSIAHMNASVLALFSLTNIGYKAAVISMLSHGFTAAGLFFLAGVLYKIYHTKNILYFGGLGQIMPRFTVFFMFFVLSNIGFPSTLNFVGEFLSLAAVQESSIFLACIFLIKTGILFIFFMSLINRICFLELDTRFLKHFNDLNNKELGVLTVLLVLTFIFGVYADGILCLL